MIFETDGYYEHSCGKLMHVCGTATTHTYGKCLIGEDNEGRLSPVGTTLDNSINWKNISKEEFFKKMKWKQ